MLEAVPRRKIRDVVADRLRGYIAESGFKPGDRLPTETALAEQFGVSRLSLREATKALEFLGIVESKPGVGLTVGRVTVQRVTAYLGFHPALQDASPIQLVETRIVIETGVLPYVMRRMQDDPSVYEALDGINGELRRARDLERWTERDIAFHHQLVEFSGLSPLLAFNDLLTVFFHRFRESVKKGEWKAGVASHQRLIDALRDRHLDAAGEELRIHIQSHLHRLGIVS
jgi:GntR family transcriptional regulator, transcriptional repressor for pyruvate dehydrogenase complex